MEATTDREQELLYIISSLRDYIANSNIPVEHEDRLYKEHLALADNALKNTHGECRCYDCNEILNERVVYPFNTAKEGEKQRLSYMCVRCHDNYVECHNGIYTDGMPELLSDSDSDSDDEEEEDEEETCDDCGRTDCVQCKECSGCIGTWNYPCMCEVEVSA